MICRAMGSPLEAADAVEAGRESPYPPETGSENSSPAKNGAKASDSCHADRSSFESASGLAANTLLQQQQVLPGSKPLVTATGGTAPEDRAKGFLGRMKDAALSGVNHDIHSIIDEDETVMFIHGNMERFDPKSEIAFQ